MTKKSPEQDRLDRQAAKNRKQRGLGGVKKTSTQEYVPLSQIARDAKVQQNRSVFQEEQRQRLIVEFSQFVATAVAGHIQAIEKSGATCLRESDKGFARILLMLKDRYRNSNVKWQNTPNGMVMFARDRKVA